MKLTKKLVGQARWCINCEGMGDAGLIVQRKRGWVHILSNKMRCPGQEDDQSEDYARPDDGPVHLEDTEAFAVPTPPQQESVNIELNDTDITDLYGTTREEYMTLQVITSTGRRMLVTIARVNED